MGLLIENNRQYYTGAQWFPVAAATTETAFTSTFNTTLTDATTTTLTNYTLEVSTDSGTTWTDYITAYPAGTYSTNGIVVTATVAVVGSATTIVRILLSDSAIASNYGGYSYISLNDVINNFLVAYVGEGKLIPNVKRTDIMFHAKRGLQEFSYDTLKSIKSQELTIPPSLSVIIPQDYVNYVKMSWIDDFGVKHIIYPTTLTSNPYTIPVQDADGVPEQDSLGNNDEGTSVTNTRWDTADDRLISGNIDLTFFNANVLGWSWEKLAYGQRYGLNPETSQLNGWFTIDEKEGKFSFSSNLETRLIILEYISDGLSVDADTKIPKLAEEAIYMHIAYSILAGRSGVQEYVVRRYKKDRSTALRNAKIRLSNIKLSEIVQVMRGKSKWIKH